MDPTFEGSADGTRALAGDRMRQLAVVGAAIAQVAGNSYVVWAGTDRFARPAAGGDPPFIPAAYAFAIWGPIFLGCALFALYQARASVAARPLLRAVGWPATIAFLATGAWPLVAQDIARVWLTAVLLLVIAVSLWVAQRAIVRERLASAAPWSRGTRLLVVAPLSVFLGWASMAAFANVAAALRDSGMTSPGSTERWITLVLLAGAAVVASRIVVGSRGNPWYAATVLWAVTSIAVANLSGETRPPDALIAIAALVAATVVVGVLVAVRRGAREPAALVRR